MEQLYIILYGERCSGPQCNSDGLIIVKSNFKPTNEEVTSHLLQTVGGSCTNITYPGCENAGPSHLEYVFITELNPEGLGKAFSQYSEKAIDKMPFDKFVEWVSDKSKQFESMFKTAQSKLEEYLMLNDVPGSPNLKGLFIVKSCLGMTLGASLSKGNDFMRNFKGDIVKDNSVTCKKCGSHDVFKGTYDEEWYTTLDHDDIHNEEFYVCLDCRHVGNIKYNE